jgi:two-component system nitrate/nitrite response regulator NarL
MSRTILVIDDLSFYRARIRNLLRQLGYVVYEAESGEEGCQVALRVTPDVVLLDQVMPDCSGPETLAALRRGGYGGPVVVLSPRPDSPDARAMLKSGAQAVIPKTASPGLLENELRRVGSAAEAA